MWHLRVMWLVRKIKKLHTAGQHVIHSSQKKNVIHSAFSSVALSHSTAPARAHRPPSRSSQ